MPEGKESFPVEDKSHNSALEETVTAQWGLTLMSGFQRWGEDGGKDTGQQIEVNQSQSKDFITSRKIPWRLQRISQLYPILIFQSRSYGQTGNAASSS